MKKEQMLCLGPKKSLSSPRLKLTAQGMVQCTNVQSSAIQAPHVFHKKYIEYFLLYLYSGRNSGLFCVQFYKRSTIVHYKASAIYYLQATIHSVSHCFHYAQQLSIYEIAHSVNLYKEHSLDNIQHLHQCIFNLFNLHLH